jgi:hypothetical protein
MALWYVLILACFGMAMGGALVPPRIANAGPGGYAIGGAVGLAVGIACAWMMWVMHRIFANWANRKSDSESWASEHEWYFRAFYFSKLLWILFTGFLGFQLSKILERFLL